eukprot:3363314-Pyramimonas_sp.AAC.1
MAQCQGMPIAQIVTTRDPTVPDRRHYGRRRCRNERPLRRRYVCRGGSASKLGSGERGDSKGGVENQLTHGRFASRRPAATPPAAFNFEGRGRPTI